MIDWSVQLRGVQERMDRLGISVHTANKYLARPVRPQTWAMWQADPYKASIRRVRQVELAIDVHEAMTRLRDWEQNGSPAA